MKNDKQEEKKDKVDDEVEEVEKVEVASVEDSGEPKEDSCDCKEKIADLENQVKRTLADYQNLEKRVRDDRLNWIKSANKDLLLRFLPILDTLMLAKQHSEDKALAVSIGQFLQALKDEGVEKIEAVGKNFDPNTMECITTAEGDEGKVIEEIRAGYKLNDIVLRPAQVKVGRHSVDSER